MKRAVLFSLGLLLAAALQGKSPPPKPQPPPTPPPPVKLYWKNGDAVAGVLSEASASDVTWKTQVFEDALQIDWHAVRKIEQPLSAVPVVDPFSISLRDGSYLYGDLRAVTKDSVSIHSARHGDAVLKRSEVLNVRRLQGGNLIFAGPTGDVGWSTADDRPNNTNNRRGSQPAAGARLIAKPGGALLMPYWNRSAFLGLTLPALVDVEFHIRSSVRPEFQLSLKGDATAQLRIETWDDDLVLTMGDQFKIIRKIPDGEREIALRLCWDRKARKCSVFTPEGEWLADWQIPESSESGASSAVALQNKGRDLSLEFLRVRMWDGKPPAKLDVNQPHLELADGRMIEGKVSAGAPESIKLLPRGEEAGTSFPLSEIDAVIFSADSPKIEPHEATLSYADGAIFMGRIASIHEGWAAVKTSFTNEPLSAQMDALRQLLIDLPAATTTTGTGVLAYAAALTNASPDASPSDTSSTTPEAPPADLDTIVIQDTTLHGQLAAAGDAEPRWRPVGGVKPAIPSKSLASEITHALPADQPLPNTPALFYLGTGDVLPGTLRSLDKSGAEVESSVMETTKLLADDLDAIQFGSTSGGNLHGFDAAGWQVLKGDEKTVQKKNDSISMQPETAIGHPSLMQSGEIKFTFDSNSFSTVRLRLFCAGTDPAKSTNLILSNMFGDRFLSGLESNEGQVDDQVRTKIQAGQPVNVRLVMGEKQVELYLNKILAQTFSTDVSRQAGAGLIIEPGGLWGNMMRPISLSGFSASSVPGRTWLPSVNVEIKTQTLSVPRFQKNDPPRHALLAANGDVLRGEIEAATPTHFAFRSGLEELHIPRDRVKVVLWLKKPEENAPPSAAVNPTLKLLDRKIEMRTTYSMARLSSFTSFLRQQEPMLKFKLPEKEDPRSFRMQFNGQTFGEALAQICSLYSLHYRIDADGAIWLEGGPTVSRDMVQKGYWLKADAFPKTASAQEILIQKGLTFPTGAAALWQSRAQLLTMTNTAENHAKLVALLASDFGGNLGSPTHWLLLTSGARLGLAVDKFEKNSISGHHPIYGHCQVPMSEIYSIRTSMPEPTAAMRSLGDWRLVFAPEPVLPEPGGESSPMIGKAAAAFKLPLLAGGNFDLSQEKGKVIVLDFWATWCGPCIKSLPGLIEVMAKFPADRVKLIGVNQSEPAAQVKRFLETRAWELTVALDAGQNVARQYGVDGIPHTVIIGPDGKVAWVKTGYSPDGETEAAAAVQRLLN